MAASSNELTPEQVAHFKEVFSIYDQGGTGTIPSHDLIIVMRHLGRKPSIDQLRDMMTEIDKQKMARGIAVDADESQTITFDDFLGCMSRQIGDSVTEKELQDAFSAFNRDGNSLDISDAEIRYVMNDYEKRAATADTTDSRPEAYVFEHGEAKEGCQSTPVNQFRKDRLSPPQSSRNLACEDKLSPPQSSRRHLQHSQSIDIMSPSNELYHRLSVALHILQMTDVQTEEMMCLLKEMVDEVVARDRQLRALKKDLDQARGLSDSIKRVESQGREQIRDMMKEIEVRLARKEEHTRDLVQEMLVKERDRTREHTRELVQEMLVRERDQTRALVQGMMMQERNETREMVGSMVLESSEQFALFRQSLEVAPKSPAKLPGSVETSAQPEFMLINTDSSLKSNRSGALDKAAPMLEVTDGSRPKSGTSFTSSRPRSSGSRKQEDVTVTFFPGPIGIRHIDGRVDTVHSGSQAEREGLKIGWRIVAVGNQKCESFEDKVFLDAKSGQKPYHVTLSKPRQEYILGKPIQDNVAFLPKKLNGEKVLRCVDSQYGTSGTYTWQAKKPATADSPGLGYRQAKTLDARIANHPYLAWDGTISGSDEGDGWVRVRLPEEATRKAPAPLSDLDAPRKNGVENAAPRVHKSDHALSSTPAPLVGKSEASAKAALDTATSRVPDCSIEEYAFSRSVWDAALFVGEPVLGSYSSAQICLCIVIVIVMAVCLGGIILDDLVNADAYDGRTRDQLQEWRSLTPASFASELCQRNANISTSSSQMRMADELAHYLAGTHPYPATFGETVLSGPTLAILVLLLWYSKVNLEFVSMFRLARALYQMRSSSARTEFEQDGGFLCLRSLSENRVAFGFGLILIRFSICVFLTCVGTTYIVHTISVQNTILNFVALSVVLDVDKLLFECLAPVQARSLIKCMRSVPLRALSHSSKLDVTTSLVYLFLIIKLFVVGIALVGPLVSQLSDAQDIICH